MECTNTSPKTIEDYMRKSAQFGYGKIGPVGVFHLLGVASTCFGTEACIGYLQDMECTKTSPKTIEDYNYYTTNI
jgi:hypothetical protein